MKPSIIRSANDPMPNGINFMLYGDPGLGKTPIIAQRPRTLILDADHGSESALGSPAEIWEINTWDDMDAAYDYLRHEGEVDFDWFWFDGITIGQSRLLGGIMEDLVIERPHRKVWQADKGEYGQNMFRLQRWVQHACALPINFGITSHPVPWMNQTTGEEVMMPWIQGKGMIPAISGMMNVIGYLTADGDGDDRLLYTKPHNGFFARDKFGALGAGMKNPTIAAIERKIMARVEEVRKGQKTTAARPTPVKKAAAKKAVAPVKKAAPRAVPSKRS